MRGTDSASSGADSQLELAFDYGDMPAAQRRKLESRAKRVRGHFATAMKSRLEMGRELAHAQEELSHHGNGMFGKWVDHHFAFGRMTAYRWIGAFRGLGGDEVCITAIQTFDDQAALLLTKDDPRTRIRVRDIWLSNAAFTNTASVAARAAP